MNGHESNENDRKKSNCVSIKGFDHSLYRLQSCHFFLKFAVFDSN